MKAIHEDHSNPRDHDQGRRWGLLFYDSDGHNAPLEDLAYQEDLITMGPFYHHQVLQNSYSQIPVHLSTAS